METNSTSLNTIATTAKQKNNNSSEYNEKKNNTTTKKITTGQPGRLKNCGTQLQNA